MKRCRLMISFIAVGRLWKAKLNVRVGIRTAALTCYGTAEDILGYSLCGDGYNSGIRYSYRPSSWPSLALAVAVPNEYRGS